MRVDIGQGVRLFFDVAGSSLQATDDEMVPKPVLLLLHGGPGARFEALGGPEARANFEALFSSEDPSSSPELWGRYFEVNLPLYNRRPSSFGPKRTWENLRVLAHANRPGQQHDLRADAPMVRCPTLVLAGEDDPIVPPVAARELHALLPAHLCRFEIFADCGHGTYRDQPEMTERALRTFLAADLTDADPSVQERLQD